MMKLNQKIVMGILVFSLFFLSSCGEQGLFSPPDPMARQWNEILSSARETQVNILVDHSDPELVKWLRGDVKDHLERHYAIELNVREEMLSRTFDQLKDDQLNERSMGSVDMLVIQNEGFKEAMEAELLYGPFVHSLPQIRHVFSERSTSLHHRDSLLTDGYFLPYGQKQLIFIYDRDFFFHMETWTDFLELVESHPGSFIYSDPRYSKEGEAFVISMLLKNQEMERWLNEDMAKEEAAELLKNEILELKGLSQYLYQSGSYFPQSSMEIDGLFNEGKVLFSLTFNYNHATEQLLLYQYPDGAHSFVPNGGTFGYSEGVVIPFNASNKAGAMVVANALLDPELQGSKYNHANMGQLPIYDLEVTDNTILNAMGNVRVRPASIRFTDVTAYRIPDISKHNRDVLIQIWEENILTP